MKCSAIVSGKRWRFHNFGVCCTGFGLPRKIAGFAAAAAAAEVVGKAAKKGSAGTVFAARAALEFVVTADYLSVPAERGKQEKNSVPRFVVLDKGYSKGQKGSFAGAIG